MLLLAASEILSVMATVLAMQSASSSVDRVAPVSYAADNDVCTNDLMESIWGALPNCEPRPEVVALDLPSDDPDVVEVIPSHVVVPRCSGVCHEGNLYHKCVPKSESRARQTFQVMFRKLPTSGSSSGMECSTVEVETHSSCKCGCDLEASLCSPKQKYDHHFCKCRCSDGNAKTECHKQRNRKFWDEHSCQCVCRPEEYRECTTGFIYDAIDSCQ